MLFQKKIIINKKYTLVKKWKSDYCKPKTETFVTVLIQIIELIMKCKHLICAKLTELFSEIIGLWIFVECLLIQVDIKRKNEGNKFVPFSLPKGVKTIWLPIFNTSVLKTCLLLSWSWHVAQQQLCCCWAHELLVHFLKSLGGAVTCDTCRCPLFFNSCFRSSTVSLLT